MERTELISSSLASAGYDPDMRTLEVEFNNGSVYRYYDVPAGVYGRLMRAQSKGRFLNAHIRDRYRYTRVEERRRR